jgi:hypothetical protein
VTLRIGWLAMVEVYNSKLFIFFPPCCTQRSKLRIGCSVTIIGLFSSPIHLNLWKPASFAAATASAALHGSVSKYAALLLSNLQCVPVYRQSDFWIVKSKVPTGQQ